MNRTGPRIELRRRGRSLAITQRFKGNRRTYLGLIDDKVWVIGPTDVEVMVRLIQLTNRINKVSGRTLGVPRPARPSP
jgi:hypothetical protein